MHGATLQMRNQRQCTTATVRFVLHMRRNAFDCGGWALYQAVDAEAPSAGRRQPVLEGRQEPLVLKRREFKSDAEIHAKKPSTSHLTPYAPFPPPSHPPTPLNPSQPLNPSASPST
eukprot:312511-Rhodomonas_salina.1